MNRIPSLSLLYLTLTLLAWSTAAFAQEPEERMRGISRANQEIPVYAAGNNYMFVIGIDEYEDWLPLRNAASDAKGIEEIFAEQFGFKPIMPALYDKEATKVNIMSSLDQIRTKLKYEDNLIIFFAGHGETRTDTLGTTLLETGYLIPVEGAGASEDHWSGFIEVESFLKQIALMPSRHVTVILDACHSGIAMGSAISSTRGSEKAPIASLALPPSRKVLTSARKDQLASDDGPLPDHSLFTGTLITGLRNGGADADQDGRVTSSELGAYLVRMVREESRDRQTPDFGSFTLDQRGEMVLELQSTTPAVLLANAQSQLAAGKTMDFVNTMKRVMDLDNLPKGAYYLTFRAALALNKIDDAERSLQRRLDMENEFELEDGSMEQLAYLDLQRVKKFINFWQPFLEVIDSSASMKVELIHEDTSVAHLSGSGVYGRYALPTNARFKIRITNLGDQPVFPHCIYFDPYGRGSQKILWEKLEVLSRGLPAGESADSHLMTHSGTQGLKEFRLFFSKQQMLDFFKPAEEMANEAVAVPPADLSIYSLRLIFDRASRTY